MKRPGPFQSRPISGIPEGTATLQELESCDLSSGGTVGGLKTGNKAGETGESTSEEGGAIVSYISVDGEKQARGTCNMAKDRLFIAAGRISR